VIEESSPQKGRKGMSSLAQSPLHRKYTEQHRLEIEALTSNELLRRIMFVGLSIETACFYMHAKGELWETTMRSICES
jgi:hypothetical protein